MTDTDRNDGIVAGPAGDAGRAGRWQYLPALDGIRALAVVAVVLFHYWPDTFPGGFVGVDVFFAMSGLLITGILQSEHRRSGGIDLRAFWGRRVRRLVPAVVVLVVVTAVATVLTGTGSSRQLADSVGALTWTTNLVEAVFGGSRTWLHNSRTTLDHLWSLAIEEQFYLVWPLVAVVLFRRLRSRRAQVGVTMVLVALSALAMGLVGGIHAYLRTDTRAFELLAGAALALSGWVLARPPAWLSGLLAAGGAAGLGVFVALVDPGDEWMYPWGFVLISVCSTALVASAAHPAPWMAAVLQSRPMRHLGQVSYGVYLWHIPVLRLLSSKRMGFEGPALHLVRFVVLALVVEASYRWVEEPFRRGRSALGWRQFAGGYLVAAAALLLLVPATSRDIDEQWDPIDGPPAAAAGATKWMVVGDIYGAAFAANASWGDAAVWSLADPGCPGLLGSGLDDGLEFDDGGRPLAIEDRPYCEHWRERWTRAVERFDPDAVLVANGFWDTLPLDLDGRPIVGDDLDDLYTDLVDRQVRSLLDAGVSADSITLVALGNWDDIVDVSQQGQLDERADAVAAYDRAIAAAVEAHGVGTVSRGQTADDVVSSSLR